MGFDEIEAIRHRLEELVSAEFNVSAGISVAANWVEKRERGRNKIIAGLLGAIFDDPKNVNMSIDALSNRLRADFPVGFMARYAPELIVHGIVDGRLHISVRRY
jgi:hypothetical protein